MALNPILMPKLGLTMTEGTLAAWHVKPGDAVRAGDLLFVVETDKISTEVEARGDGRIDKILVAEQETVGVGAAVAMWTGQFVGAELDDSVEDDDAEAAPSSRLEQSVEQSAFIEPKITTAQSPAVRLIATPLARRIAQINLIPLDTVLGTGPRNRIKAQDVRVAIAAQSSPVIAEIPKQVPARGSRRPATSFEKTVARRLTESKQQIPHFYVSADADLTELAAMRARLNEGSGNTKISINHLILMAVGRALLERPEVAMVWDNEHIIEVGGSDVGFAVDTERGLFAPVVRAVGEMRIDELARSADDASQRARVGALGQNELSGGTITVSNVGMFGASWLLPIINPGQSAILGVGAATSQFRPDPHGAPVVRQIGSLVFSGDHRVLNGVIGAKFLNTVIRQLESPLELLR